MSAPLSELLRERLAEHLIGFERRAYPAYACKCGEWDGAFDDDGGPDDGANDNLSAALAHVTDALMPLVTEAAQQARAEALSEAADFIAGTAGIGNSSNDFGAGWYGALDYAIGELRNRSEATR